QYVPIGDKFELNLGVDPDVVFELSTQKSWRDDIWLSWNGGRIVRRVDDGRVEIDVHADVVGWNQNRLQQQRIYNTTGRPIEVEIRRRYSGQWTFRHDGLNVDRYDAWTAEIDTTVKAGEDQRLVYETIHTHGRNAKQNRLEIEEGKVGPE
ncbi:MAG: hypothetical protein R3336_08175, partial [Phycisphaeraceae bacterium]|nr:hypothetical protein [Phycisphaeraceae bacterium]